MWSNIGGSHPRRVSVPPRFGLWALAGEAFTVVPASARPLNASRSRRERVMGPPWRSGKVRPCPALITRTCGQRNHRAALHLKGVDPRHVRAGISRCTISSRAPPGTMMPLRIARETMLAALECHGPVAAWVVDDTGIPKTGRHSVGVAGQYRGVLG